MKKLRLLLRNLQHLPKLMFSQHLYLNQLQLHQLLQRKSTLLKMAMLPILRSQMFPIIKLNCQKNLRRKKKKINKKDKRKRKKIFKKKKRKLMMSKMEKKRRKTNEYLHI